jgi:hypothetical protein
MGVPKNDVWVAFEGIGAVDFYLGPDSVQTVRARRKQQQAAS